jgi:hypothetical protein
MRAIPLAGFLVLALATGASGQPPARFLIGPVLRVDQVFIEGDASGGIGVAGVVASVGISNNVAVEAEVTSAGNRIQRTYDGWFVSYVTSPNPTREEIERWAPIARRTLRYTPGIGWSTAVVVRGGVGPRVDLAARVGASGRRYLQTSAYEVLSIPAGVDPERVARDFQSSSSHRTRGGLLLGVDLPVMLTDHVSAAPQVRFVYGGPARVGNKHRELGAGVRVAWRF